jgi:hypothetical protein
MAVVALLQAEAGSTPTGTGSFSYFTNFQVSVENIAFVKDVGIWGHDTASGTWGLFPCHYDHSVPNNNEVWQVHVNTTEIDAFDVRYQVAGSTYWDNNGGFNYALDTAAAHTDGIGTAVVGPNLRAVAWGVDPSGTLNVDVLIKNLAFVKQVAIVFTVNGWLTFSNALGSFQRMFPPSTLPHQIQSELWKISVPVTAGPSRKFAVFYTVGGFTYWDNNFGLDYSF